MSIWNSQCRQMLFLNFLLNAVHDSKHLRWTDNRNTLKSVDSKWWGQFYLTFIWQLRIRRDEKRPRVSQTVSSLRETAEQGAPLSQLYYILNDPFFFILTLICIASTVSGNEDRNQSDAQDNHLHTFRIKSNMLADTSRSHVLTKGRYNVGHCTDTV